MIKQTLTTLLILLGINSVYAFEDCIITSDGKLTDIKIEDKTIADIYPLVTLLNEKNTLIVHPLKEGETKVCILKNGKNLIDFNIKVTSEQTIIDDTKGIEIFSLDAPEPSFQLDEPPILNETGAHNG